MKFKTKIAGTIVTLSLCSMTYNGLYAYGYNKTAEEYDKIIKSLYQKNSMDSIKTVLDEALSLYPNDTDLNRWAGTYFLQKKETDNARYYLIKAIQQDAENYLAKQQMVALEEELGNLSSAICYVNEMLELYPYDQVLWKKKIGLYRKQGNDIEADRLLTRLYTIFPNDSVVRNDYTNRLEEVYMNKRREGKREEAIMTLKKLIGYKNKEKTYYLDLANLLFLQGHSEEAVATLSQGLEYFPADNELLRKKAEIMAERGYGRDAVGLLQKSNSKELYPIASEIMIEAARNESWKDPYVLYGRIYESEKSSEALDYLMRTSISRGYDDDALYYLSEYRKRYGNSPEILYKEYMIFRRTGNKKSALKTLEKYVGLVPSDKDMSDELALLKMEIAVGYINDNIFDEAIPVLKSALSYSTDEEISSSVSNKLLYCYLSSNKNEKAIEFIDSMRSAKNNNSIYAEQKAEALHRMGKSEMAISELERNGYSNSETYETISLGYIKKLMEAGAERKAYSVSKNWIEKAPESQSGLMSAVSTSEALEKYDESDILIAKGKVLYPDEPFFVQKEAASFYRKKEYQAGMDVLKTWVDSLSGNKELVSVYSANAEMRAQDFLKAKDADTALSIIEDAKRIDNANQELLLLEGSAYEMKGDYESAYASYSKYKPEAMWMREYKRKLYGVQNRGYRNTISADVLSGWYSDGSRPNTIISAAYTRKMKKDYITSTCNISFRNTTQNGVASEVYTVSDNTGAQLKVDWGHTFNKRWATVLGVGVSSSIFPTWLGQVGAFYTFPKDFELGVTVGYRKNYTPLNVVLNNQSGNMYNLRVSGNIYRGLWRVNTNCDAFMLNKGTYFNLNSQLKYYPAYDGNTHILITAGVGTAPEIDFVDKLMPGSFEKLNASLGVGGVYMVSKNISLGLNASFHYFYNQTEETGNEENTDRVIINYKNLYDIYAHVIFSF